MDKFTGYIYSITNELNGKSYIGKTNDLVRRWKEHCYGSGRTAILNKAFKKYGLEHFVFDIVAQIPFDNIEELNDVLAQLEIYYIELYDTFHHGYNATVGGEGTSGYKQFPETTEKIRKANIGKIVSNETKARISVNRKGIGHSAETKQKITKALLSRDHSIYEKSSAKLKGKKRNHEMIMRGALKRRKPILQYDLQGNFIKEWEGACCIEGFDKINIGMCCKGKLMSSQGYIWRYKEKEDFPRKIQVPSKWKAFKKPVIQYNLDGNFIAEFESVTKAAEAINVNVSSIFKCLNGNNQTCGKYIWKYKKDMYSKHVEVPHINHTWESRVMQYNKQGDFINEYDSITIASRITNIGRTSINNCLHGRSNSAGGYIWKYKKEMEVENEAR